MLLNSEQAANGQDSPSKNLTESNRFSLMHLSAFSSTGYSFKVTSGLKEQLMEAAVSESSSHISQPFSYGWEAAYATVTPHSKYRSPLLE